MSTDTSRNKYGRQDPFQSSRLVYRAVEESIDDEFILRCQQQNLSYQNYSCSLPTPRSIKTAAAQRIGMEDKLLSVIICVERDPELSTGLAIPIGILTMERPDPSRHHHRRALIGLFILDDYQGQGYGSEAIRWCLRWGFESPGLHRIGIECVSWSEGLHRLYQKLGFRLEGTLRDYYWFEGKWRDYYMLSILENEWREQRDTTEDQTGQVITATGDQMQGR